MKTLALILAFEAFAPAEDTIPLNQKPILKLYLPAAAEQSKPGSGKFVIFTRRSVGKDWDFIADVWECIPDKPLTKRAEFCHSSWTAAPLLDSGVGDDSRGTHPRFVRLQVDAKQGYTVNLYDIDYRTWDVKCIWQGDKLAALGVFGDSMVCRSGKDLLSINSSSGKIATDAPFTPLQFLDGYWLVRKPGEVDGCWSYDRLQGKFIAHFGPLADDTKVASKLSTDGKHRLAVRVTVPQGWNGGLLSATLILQGGTKDVTVPIEIRATAGSGVPVIPHDLRLDFTPDGKARLLTRKGSEDREWTIDLASGAANAAMVAAPVAGKTEAAQLGGVPVPEYLRKHAEGLGHFGRDGLAVAFMLHAGEIKEKPQYPDCTAGVSRDGRHVLFKAKNSSQVLYGDTLTRTVLRWQTPEGFDAHAAEFAWVVTP